MERLAEVGGSAARSSNNRESEGKDEKRSQSEIVRKCLCFSVSVDSFLFSFSLRCPDPDALPLSATRPVIEYIAGEMGGDFYGVITIDKTV